MGKPTRRETIAAIGVSALAVSATTGVSATTAQESRPAPPGADPTASLRASAYPIEDLSKRNAQTEGPYLRFFDNNTMSAGLYELKAGSTDGQSPHALDEFYVVMKGRSKFMADGDVFTAEPGAILFVKAQVEHRFYDIEEDLQLAVFFSKAAP